MYSPSYIFGTEMWGAVLLPIILGGEREGWSPSCPPPALPPDMISNVVTEDDEEDDDADQCWLVMTSK